VFLSGNCAKGFYKGVNLRQHGLSLIKNSIPGIEQEFLFSKSNEEKSFLHDGKKSKKHQNSGRPYAIWCPEVGYKKPALKRISSSDAYNNLLSSIQINTEYGFDLRLCHNQIKHLVRKLPAYTICLTENISENYFFMKEVLDSSNQDEFLQ
jgi:hypothetical protein